MKMLEAVSGLAVRFLDRRRIEALRNAYFSARTRLYPLMRAMHGSFDASALRAHLEQRIGHDFEILMVHSSVNHMIPMYTGTALDLVRMLVEYCGPSRTLAMPAFYFGEPGFGGAYATFKAKPRFDLRRTPSMMGIATELFRRWPGVRYSRHPVYRVCALGPLAEEVTTGHEFADTPSGKGTPFEVMARRDTLVIGIGKPVQVLTQAHHAEAVMGDEFPVPRNDSPSLPMTLVDGKEEIAFNLPGNGFAWRFDIWRLRKIMSAERLREWNFHHVPMFSARAAHVTDDLISAARRGVTLYVAP